MENRIKDGKFIFAPKKFRDSIENEYENFCDGDLDVGEHPTFQEWLIAKLYDEK